MKSLLTNLGPVIMLIGVIILAVYYFTASTSNMYLGTSAALVVAGFFIYIIANKFIK